MHKKLNPLYASCWSDYYPEDIQPPLGSYFVEQMLHTCNQILTERFELRKRFAGTEVLFEENIIQITCCIRQELEQLLELFSSLYDERICLPIRVRLRRDIESILPLLEKEHDHWLHIASLLTSSQTRLYCIPLSDTELSPDVPMQEINTSLKIDGLKERMRYLS